MPPRVEVSNDDDDTVPAGQPDPLSPFEDTYIEVASDDDIEDDVMMVSMLHRLTKVEESIGADVAEAAPPLADAPQQVADAPLVPPAVPQESVEPRNQMQLH